MNVTRDGTFYQISRITGPTHNLLRVGFADREESAAPNIQTLPPIGECRHAPMDAQKIIRAVLEGVAEANAACGTDFAVSRVQWVADDTPPETTYSYLARKLVEHLAG